MLSVGSRYQKNTSVAEVHKKMECSSRVYCLKTYDNDPE